MATDFTGAELPESSKHKRPLINLISEALSIKSCHHLVSVLEATKKTTTSPFLYSSIPFVK
jgi:hypothetical protein